MFSLYNVFVILATHISCFGFEGRVKVLIAQVPVHCLLVLLTTIHVKRKHRKQLCANNKQQRLMFKFI